MGKCVFCGNLSNSKKNTALHKFPRDEQLCKEWLRLIGLGLRIKSSTFLCSDHFTQDSFVVYYNRKCLKPGTVPTILTKEARFQEQRDVLVGTNCRDNAQDVAIISDKENHEPWRNVLMEVNCTGKKVCLR